MIKVSEFYDQILKKDGSQVASNFKDEIVAWDASPWGNVRHAFYSEDVLEMLYKQSKERI